MPTARPKRSGRDAEERKTEKCGDNYYVQSEGSCLSQEQGLDRRQDQEGMQDSSSRVVCVLEQEKVPLLYRLRMDCNRQDQANIFLQEYRRIVTSIRREDIGVHVHDKRFPMPSMCGSSHMPRKEEGSAHKRTKPQTPTPKGDISSTDERVKADRETQRRERGQAKQRALQHANVPAKASMRDRGTESETNVVRKRPAQSEDEPLMVSESVSLPATLAEREISQSASTTAPQQVMPAEEQPSSQIDAPSALTTDEPQPSQASPQQGNQPVEETTPIQSGESSIQGSSEGRKGGGGWGREGRKGEGRRKEVGRLG